MAPAYQIPSSILIVGSGVFGLSTAYALTQDSDYSDTKIILLDKWPFESYGSETSSANPTASSTDTSRIVRSDYTNGPYADLAIEAQKRWRGEWGGDGRYSQSGYILVAKEGDTEMSEGGINHVILAYENAVRVAGDDTSIQHLNSEADIEGASGYSITDTKGPAPFETTTQWKGYLNRASGWVDAAASMQFLRAKVKATNRVEFICGIAQKLLYSSATKYAHQSSSRRAVLGVLLKSGHRVLASQTILAAGPYTPGLTDLRAVCEARGQVITYVRLAPEEISQLPAGGNPSVMDASSGIFVVGPDREGFLKITRDAKGYRNPVRITVARDGQPHLADLEKTTAKDVCNSNVDITEEERQIETSLPSEGSGDWQRTVPPDGEADCRAFLRRLFPSSSPLREIASRAFERTRTCWYCDTRTANFVISYHPSYADGSLVIATGGSGHGFKFLPVIGEKIVTVLKCGPDDDDDDDKEEKKQSEGEIGGLRSLWKFPRPRGVDDDGVVECEDGSRHGRGDMIFEESMKADIFVEG